MVGGNEEKEGGVDGGFRWLRGFEIGAAPLSPIKGKTEQRAAQTTPNSTQPKTPDERTLPLPAEFRGQQSSQLLRSMHSKTSSWHASTKFRYTFEGVFMVDLACLSTGPVACLYYIVQFTTSSS